MNAIDITRGRQARSSDRFAPSRKRAFEEGYRVGQKPVDVDTVKDVLAPDLDGLEARLTRNGYHAKVLTEMLGAKPKEVRAFLGGQLPAERTQELHDHLLAAGVPI